MGILFCNALEYNIGYEEQTESENDLLNKTDVILLLYYIYILLKLRGHGELQRSAKRRVH